jgi:hypothetical protein
LAALLINTDAAADEDVEAIFRTEAEKHGLAAKENDGELGVGVLEGEIDMAGRGWAEVGDFAFNPDIAVLLLDEFADLRDEFADGPDAAGRSRIVEREVELGRERVVEGIANRHWYEV